MNRLWVRITLAMLLITVISVLTVSVLAHVSAAAQFNAFVERQRTIAQSDLMLALADHFENTGSWTGADAVLTAAVPNFSRDERRPASDPQATGPAPVRRPGRPTRRPTRFVLADAAGQIVVGEAGQTQGTLLSADQRAIALPIRVNDQTAGYLLVSSGNDALLSEAQEIFLAELRRNIAASVLVASMIAIAFGALLSRALAAPLAELAHSARTLSARRLDVRTQPRGAQEIADVAVAFNSMAESLQKAEINRRNLTADIAHELRTPLTVIQGNLRALLDGVYPFERAEISTVYDETLLLGRLVEDLRVLALAEAGQLDLRSQAVPVSALLNATAAQFQIAAENAEVRLIAQADADLPALQGDPDRIAQIMRNLVHNALRHTPAGGSITLSAQRHDTMLRMSVRDSGEGITAEKLPHVFDRFFRGDPSRARESGGSGLGLAIVKSMIQAMGGRVGAESSLGKGSEFWFELPTS